MSALYFGVGDEDEISGPQEPSRLLPLPACVASVQGPAGPEQYVTEWRWLDENGEREGSGDARANSSSSSVRHADPGDSVRRTRRELGKGREGRLPLVYVITPTYSRLTQTTDLLRLCYTLSLVPHVHWVVVEDSRNKTDAVRRLLASCRGPTVTHLHVQQPKKGRVHHRGVEPRNEALRWIYGCVRPGPHSGGVYFADDDNTYDTRVFEAARWTDLVSVWLVGTVGGALYEGPVCSNGKVKHWLGVWGKWRTFPLDMAAFSVSVNLLLHNRTALFSHDWKAGTLETGFLQALNITIKDLKPEPDANCSQILAWHTQTKSPHVRKPVEHYKGKNTKT